LVDEVSASGITGLRKTVTAQDRNGAKARRRTSQTPRKPRTAEARRRQGAKAQERRLAFALGAVGLLRCLACALLGFRASRLPRSSASAFFDFCALTVGAVRLLRSFESVRPALPLCTVPVAG
jgi:hypothetical protein